MGQGLQIPKEIMVQALLKSVGPEIKNPPPKNPPPPTKKKKPPPQKHNPPNKAPNSLVVEHWINWGFVSKGCEWLREKKSC